MSATRAQRRNKRFDAIWGAYDKQQRAAQLAAIADKVYAAREPQPLSEADQASLERIADIKAEMRHAREEYEEGCYEQD